MSRRAFTLIELLIVVAIIAILAAIAVPNFMEAQVRAKITRIRSDMRAVATAIESYVTDHGLIMGTRDIIDQTGLRGQAARLVAYTRLTTPIAYISTFPRDPFELDEIQERDEDVFQLQASNSFSTNGWQYPRARGYLWGLGSYGPRLMRDGPVFRHVLRGKTLEAQVFIYDPTNGTKSAGWIIRTNKGEMTTPDTSSGV